MRGRNSCDGRTRPDADPVKCGMRPGINPISARIILILKEMIFMYWLLGCAKKRQTRLQRDLLPRRRAVEADSDWRDASDSPRSLSVAGGAYQHDLARRKRTLEKRSMQKPGPRPCIASTLRCRSGVWLGDPAAAQSRFLASLRRVRAELSC